MWQIHFQHSTENAETVEPGDEHGESGWTNTKIEWRHRGNYENTRYTFKTYKKLSTSSPTFPYFQSQPRIFYNGMLRHTFGRELGIFLILYGSDVLIFFISPLEKASLLTSMSIAGDGNTDAPCPRREINANPSTFQSLWLCTYFFKVE